MSAAAITALWCAPLAGAAAALLAPSSRIARRICLAAALAPAGIALALFVADLGSELGGESVVRRPWLLWLRADYHVAADALSLLWSAVVAVVVASLLTVDAGERDDGTSAPSTPVAWLCVLESAALCALVARDLVLLVAAWECALLCVGACWAGAAWTTGGAHARGRRTDARRTPTLGAWLHASSCALLMLAALALRAWAGTSSLPALVELAARGSSAGAPTLDAWVLPCFAVACALRFAVAHRAEAERGGVPILGAVAALLAGSVFLRVALPVSGDGRMLAVFAALIGAAVCVQAAFAVRHAAADSAPGAAQARVPQVELGLFAVAAGTLTGLGWLAAAIGLAHHALSRAWLVRARGRRLGRVALAASLGLPPFSGAASVVLALVAAVRTRHPTLIAAAAVGGACWLFVAVTAWRARRFDVDGSDGSASGVSGTQALDRRAGGGSAAIVLLLLLSLGLGCVGWFALASGRAPLGLGLFEGIAPWSVSP